MFDQVIHAAAAGSAAQAGTQLGQVFSATRCDDFHVAVLGVAYPAAQVEFAGLAVHEPAKAYTLHTSSNQKMKNHR